MLGRGARGVKAMIGSTRTSPSRRQTPSPRQLAPGFLAERFHGVADQLLLAWVSCTVLRLRATDPRNSRRTYRLANRG